MDRLKFIFDKIAANGFAESTLLEINNYINDIQNGTEDFSRFNLSEHAGLCTAGAPLIGASIVASYAAASLAASSNAGGSQGSSPANWQIDELQEQLVKHYISDRLALEDMHPANVFIDKITARPICIDCIVKFVKTQHLP